MNTQSLGKILSAQINVKKAQCLLELEEKSAQNGMCAERDLQIIKDFFRLATTQFTTDILARIGITPLLLGDGKNEQVAAILQTYRWKRENRISQPTHSYNAVWVSFEAWCSVNDLLPLIEHRCDGIGKRYWYELSVQPVISQNQVQQRTVSELAE